MENAPPSSADPEGFHFAVFCPVQRELLRVLRRFITNLAEEMGFPDDDVIKIELAVDEACSNIARHAYGAEKIERYTIELKLRLESGALAIQVQDYGKGSAEELRGASSIEDYRRLDRERFDGLGLLIIRKFMDEVRVDSRPGHGTTVLMRKRLPEGRNYDRPGDPLQATFSAG